MQDCWQLTGNNLPVTTVSFSWFVNSLNEKGLTMNSRKLDDDKGICGKYVVRALWSSCSFVANTVPFEVSVAL